MPKIKIDPDMPLTEFLKQHCSRVGSGYKDTFFHTESFFEWDGAYLYLVPKEDVPDRVIEDLRLDAVV